MPFKGFSLATQSNWEQRACCASFCDINRLCFTGMPCSKRGFIVVVCMMTISPSLSSSGSSHSRPVQVIPGSTIWLRKGHTGADQCQLSRCSTGTSRVTSEGYRRQEQLWGDTVFTPDSPPDTSVITSESQWRVVRLLPQSHCPYSLSPSKP